MAVTIRRPGFRLVLDSLFPFSDQCPGGVMFPLTDDVGAHLGDIVRADGGGAVRALPREDLAMANPVTDQVGRCSLHMLDQIVNADRDREPDQQVHMVLSATDRYHLRP